MTVESVTYIDDLNATYPEAGDVRSEGDDHIRNIKSGLKTTFPGVTGAVTATHTELNLLDGVTATTAELNILDGVTATAAELNELDHSNTTGTFTPVLNDGDGHNASASSALGYYIRLGNVVFFNLQLLNINTSGLTAGNDVWIAGLPVASVDTVSLPCSTFCAGVSFAADSYVVAEVANNSSSIILREVTTGAGIDNIIVSELASGTADLRINGMYFAA